MYDFDGQHKSGSKVSLGGSSKKVDKISLLQSAKEERTLRERSRKQHVAALKIQKWFQGCVLQKHLVLTQRVEFDNRVKDGIDCDNLAALIENLSRFYNSSSDYSKLIFVCQATLKCNTLKKLQQMVINNKPSWLARLKMLLFICCRSLNLPDVNLSIPLRMLEVFTDMRTYLYLGEREALNTSANLTTFLVRKAGYFNYLRQLINIRVPGDIVPCVKSPTPFADAAKDLVLRPLTTHAPDILNHNVIIVHKLFIEEILSPCMSQQICYFLVPSLALKLRLSNMFFEGLKKVDSLSVYTLYALLSICVHQIEKISEEEALSVIGALNVLLPYLRCEEKKMKSSHHYSSDEEEEEEMHTQNVFVSNEECIGYVNEQCMKHLNSTMFVSLVSQLFKSNLMSTSSLIQDLSSIVLHLIHHLHVPIHKSPLMYNMAFHQQFLQLCWKHLLAPEIVLSVTGKCISQIHLLSTYTRSSEQLTKAIKVFTVFTALFKYALFSIYDTDFYSAEAGSETSLMPFTILEVLEMSRLVRDVIINLIQLIYPDIHGADQHSYIKYQFSCQMAASLLKQLYARDCRRGFCPKDLWLSNHVMINEENLSIGGFVGSQEVGLETKPTRSLMTLRSLTILEYVPFAVPFLQRIRIFQRILEEDKKLHQSYQQTVLPTHSLNISVNRKYLYQDAYDQLSQDRAPDIKKVIRIHMVNTHGLDEAGIDGGGVFREFISQLLRSGFDPSIGFFKTTSQQLLYPNPDVGLIQADYLKHLHFLGRMLGKVIYESMMVELPLADFFLCKLLNKVSSDVDIHHLESMDPELYKNLLSLKNYEGDVDELALNFTVANSNYGDTRVSELKPGGRDICVTNDNRIEYIHLMADYRLNKQIRNQCNAFRSGLADVINLEWLQMFDQREFQILISGAPIPIDIADLRSHTNYSGSYSDTDFYMQRFWEILEELSDNQKRLFLKFVTSCSRPPLLGFSELYPRFCIHSGGEEDRLPTASTCMNFLKLPKYESAEQLRARLIYAIESDAGFELS